MLPIALTLAAGNIVNSSRRMMTWQSVQAEVLARIRNGQWKPGELIPTEVELAAEFGCARATINRALTSLASTGLLERRRKVGTRVAAHPPRQSTLPKTWLRDEIEARGHQYRYRLISLRNGIAPVDVARQMMLPAGSTLIEVRSDFTASGTPYCVEEFWLNPEAVPAPGQSDLAETCAFEWLADNVAMNRGAIDVSATNTGTVDPFVGQTLSLAPGAAILLVQRTIWSGALTVGLSRQYFREGHKLSALF